MSCAKSISAGGTLRAYSVDSVPGCHECEGFRFASQVPAAPAMEPVFLRYPSFDVVKPGDRNGPILRSAPRSFPATFLLPFAGAAFDRTWRTEVRTMRASEWTLPWLHLTRHETYVVCNLHTRMFPRFTHIYIYIYTHVDTLIYIYVYIYTYTYAESCRRSVCMAYVMD